MSKKLKTALDPRSNIPAKKFGSGMKVSMKTLQQITEQSSFHNISKMFAKNKEKSQKCIVFKNVDLKCAYQPAPSIYDRSVLKNYMKASHQKLIINEGEFLPKLPGKKTI